MRILFIYWAFFMLQSGTIFKLFPRGRNVNFGNYYKFPVSVWKLDPSQVIFLQCYQIVHILRSLFQLEYVTYMHNKIFISVLKTSYYISTYSFRTNRQVRLIYQTCHLNKTVESTSISVLKRSSHWLTVCFRFLITYSRLFLPSLSVETAQCWEQ